MDNQPQQTLLRNLSNDKTQAFDPEHAQRILSYPNGGWGEVAENEVSGDGAGTQLPAADDTEKQDAGSTAPARTSRKAPGTAQ